MCVKEKTERANNYFCETGQITAVVTWLMAAIHMFRLMTMENKLWVTPRPEQSTQEDHRGRYVIFHHHYFPFLLSPKQEIVLAQIPGASQCNEACTVRVCVCVRA